MFKRLAAFRIAKAYGFYCWDVLLPTGADCIYEQLLREEGVVDEFGQNIDIIDMSIDKLIHCCIPIFGVFYMISLIYNRFLILHNYIVPCLVAEDVEFSDWQQLIFTLIPPAFYLYIFRTWRKEEYDDISVREDT